MRAGQDISPQYGARQGRAVVELQTSILQHH